MSCQKSQPSLLYPLLLGDEVNFRLTYDGPLKAAGQSDTRRTDKHHLRLVFHRQLKELMIAKNIVAEEVKRSLKPQQYYADLLHAGRNKFKRGEFHCFPLVREELNLVCDLDILFLRRDNPGHLIKSGGDLDNRIKTLFDALRLPQDDNEVRGFAPDPTDLSLLCLTEDDKLITGFRVTTDRLLEPCNTAAEQNNVRLIINVEIKATKLTQINMGYFSHF
jgi:hypothetical protein